MTIDVRYPIGQWIREPHLDAAGREACLAVLAALPSAIAAAVSGLTDAQLDTPYRDGGWCARQVVHHVADSHVNGYVRFKLGLTEPAPAIKAFNEAAWADTPDNQTPVSLSLGMIEGVHRRLVVLLKACHASDFERTIRHPERGVLTLSDLLSLYAWHGRHHVATIATMRRRKGW